MRPANPLIQLITRRMSTMAFGDLIGGLLLFLAAYRFWKFQTRYYESSGH